MKEYKEFFIKTILTFLISIVVIPSLLITLGNYFVGKHVYSKSAAHIHYWIEKKLDRANVLKLNYNNKIVFLSGSSLMYGLNSKYATEKTGLPILNMGIHAAFGSYIFKLAKDVLQDGDIVVLAVELPYYEVEKDVNIQGPFAEYIISYDNSYYRKSSIRKKVGFSMFLIQQYLKNPKIVFEKDLVDLSYKSQVNDYGDFVGNVGTTALYKETAQPQFITENIPKKLEKLELYNFIKYCRKHDISVYAIMPIMYHSKEFTLDEEIAYNNIKEFYKNSGVQFIGDMKSGCLYDVNLFHDTSAHTNTKGAKIRTDWIIDNVLSKNEFKSIK